MRISIISSNHHFNDDRLYYHFAKSLTKEKHQVEIVTCDTYLEEKNKIFISSFNGKKLSRKERESAFINKLSIFKPDIIICSDPITILVAKKYSKKTNIKIIYDITEYYPSKNNIRKHIFGTKILFSIIYFSFFIYSCKIVNGFIIGEFYKGILPLKLFPKKNKVQISYYPHADYISPKEPNLKQNELRLSYSGHLSIEKGVLNFLNVIKELITLNNELTIYVKFIGDFNLLDKEEIFNLINTFPKNVIFTYYKFQELSNYIKLINDSDIFLDLRSNDLINTHCLPIKLFYYMALKRPVIFFNSKAIKKEIEISTCGYLEKPNNSKKIANLILNYQNNLFLYQSHCSNARRLFESKYNWNVLEPKLINFIEKID